MRQLLIILFFAGLLQNRAELLPVDGCIEFGERIASVIDTLQPDIEVEKSELVHVGLRRMAVRVRISCYNPESVRIMK